MAGGRLIVWERSNHWAVALRWMLASERVCLHQPRVADEFWSRLAAFPASVAVLELERDLTDIGAWLLRLRSRYPRALAIVVGQPAMSDAMWLARELGAAHCVTSIRDLAATVALIRRHLLQARGEAATIREEIWNRMPWAALQAPPGRR